MKFLDELKALKLYKLKVWLPIDMKDKKKGSVLYLLTPNYQSTVNTINSDKFFDTRYYNAYYVEKDISYIIDSNHNLVRNANDPDIQTAVQEGLYDQFYLTEKADYSAPYIFDEEYVIDDRYLATKESILFFPDNDDENVPLSENAANDVLLRKLLFKERIRTTQDLMNIHNKIKEDCPKITRTKLQMSQYKGFNLYYDLSYYNSVFFKNNMYKLKRGTELYLDLMSRIIKDKRLATYGYKNDRLIMIPIDDWGVNRENKKYLFKNDINPISILVYLLRYDIERMKEEFKDLTFLFYTNKGYFKVDINSFTADKYQKFLTLIDNITDPNYTIEEDEIEVDSSKVITASIIDKIEKISNIEIDDISKTSNAEMKVAVGDDGIEMKADMLDKLKYQQFDSKEMKRLLVQKVEKAAEENPDEDSAMEELEDDEEVKRIINDLMMNDDKGVKISAARSARLTALNSEFEKKEINNKSIKELLSSDASEVPLKKTSLPIDTINEEWQNLSFMNFEKSYDIDADIIKILHFFSTRDYPISIINLEIEDTSTSQDWIYTYKAECEDIEGNRFTLVFDIPKFKNNRFMMLRGNEKVMNGQLALIGVSKTDEDTVQIVSNYKKIFIRRYGTRSGKSYPLTDRIAKALKKYEGSKIKIKEGYNGKVCKNYDLPIDYVDLACTYTTISTKNYTVYFNQNEIRKKHEDIINKKTVLIPYAYDKKNHKIIYSDPEKTFSENLINLLNEETDGEFGKLCERTMLSTKYCYSKASILDTEIPLVILMAYSEGLQKTLQRAHVKYTFKENKEYDKLTEDVIKFEDGYLVYKLDYNSSLLLNGLKESDTANYRIAEIDSKAMYLDFLEDYGGRIKADGIENFYQLEVDPITLETLKRFKLPTEYCDLLAFANELLADNVYTKHTDLCTNRYRTNEQIAAYLYSELATEYGRYRTAMRRDRKSKMSVKRTAIIDRLLQARELSDLSILTPLLEVESANTASFKGLSGMNSEQAYSLDKRVYDDSMINVLALSTGFAGNVGINRQATIDMNIDSTRGYIKAANTDEMGVTKTLSMTEALSPFCSTRDDPIRMAMNFVQSSKHTMITDYSDPLLISNGADEAMAYICSDTYSTKAKDEGIIKELTDDYMIIEYPKLGKSEYVNLKKNVRKNSDGGFYVTVKLDAAKDLKVGDKVQPNQIVAYNPKMFSEYVGSGNELSYNIGPLCKVAIPVSDEGYEDSAIISEWLSEALAFTLTTQVECTIDKNCSIFSMKKKGDKITEGEPLIIYQDAYNDDDVNALLKAISSDQFMNEFGRTYVKSKITGYIEDIEILRTCEVEETTESVQKIIKEYEAPITKTRKLLEKYDPDAAKNLPADYKLPATGRLKNCEEKIKIIFYLSYKNKMTVGNKLTYFSALKGIVKDIFPGGDEPVSEYRPDEKVHAFLSAPSTIARMTISPFENGGINKVCIELARHCRDIMGLPNKNLDDYLEIKDDE